MSKKELNQAERCLLIYLTMSSVVLVERNKNLVNLKPLSCEVTASL